MVPWARALILLAGFGLACAEPLGGAKSPPAMVAEETDTVLQGRLVDSDGRPVSALVAIYRDPETLVASQHTAADGRFSFSEVLIGEEIELVAVDDEGQGLVRILFIDRPDVDLGDLPLDSVAEHPSISSFSGFGSSDRLTDGVGNLQRYFGPLVFHTNLRGLGSELQRDASKQGLPPSPWSLPLFRSTHTGRGSLLEIDLATGQETVVVDGLPSESLLLGGWCYIVNAPTRFELRDALTGKLFITLPTAPIDRQYSLAFDDEHVVIVYGSLGEGTGLVSIPRFGEPRATDIIWSTSPSNFDLIALTEESIYLRAPVCDRCPDTTIQRIALDDLADREVVLSDAPDYHTIWTDPNGEKALAALTFANGESRLTEIRLDPWSERDVYATLSYLSLADVEDQRLLFRVGAPAGQTFPSVEWLMYDARWDALANLSSALELAGGVVDICRDPSIESHPGCRGSLLPEGGVRLQGIAKLEGKEQHVLLDYDLNGGERTRFLPRDVVSNLYLYTGQLVEVFEQDRRLFAFDREGPSFIEPRPIASAPRYRQLLRFSQGERKLYYLAADPLTGYQQLYGVGTEGAL